MKKTLNQYKCKISLDQRSIPTASFNPIPIVPRHLYHSYRIGEAYKNLYIHGLCVFRPRNNIMQIRFKQQSLKRYCKLEDAKLYYGLEDIESLSNS